MIRSVSTTRRSARIFRGFAILALVASCLLATGCDSHSNVDRTGKKTSTKVVTLTLANHEQGPGDIGVWIDAVERLSKGTLRIRVVNDWRLRDVDYDTKTIADVQAGRVALAKIAARAYDAAGVMSFQPLLAPMLIDSFSLEARVLRSVIGRRALQRSSAQLGVVGLALLAGPLRRPVGISRPLPAPSAFHGARIWVREGDVGLATMRSLGAEPVKLPPGSALDSVDGAELDFDPLKNNPSVTRVQSVAQNVAFWPKPITIMMNAGVFASLTAGQRHALREAASAAFAAEVKVTVGIVNDALSVLCSTGVPFVRSDARQIAAFRTAVQPVYRLIERSLGNRETIRRIVAMKGREPADSAECSRTSRSKGSGRVRATPIDGTYEATFTKQQLIDSGVLLDAGEINDENWGELTLRLLDGRMQLTQRKVKNTSTLTGRYTVVGDVIRMFTDQYKETFVFHWTLYRDTLKLQRDKQLGVGLSEFLVKSWRRLGA
jgi:TRAP-type C4-dicarboxylate transport system substrate-binding protein